MMFTLLHDEGIPALLPGGIHHRRESIKQFRFTSVVVWSAPCDTCSMVAQPYQIYVERKDAARNMARYYRLSIEPDLFGEVCLIRQWGRIGARGQSKTHQFETERDAVALFLNLLRQKRRRGYRPRKTTLLT